MTEDEQARMASHWQRTAAIVVTNSIKVGGLVLGLHEAFTTKTPTVMAFAAFMMAGARVSETVLLRAIDRFFGREAGQE